MIALHELHGPPTFFITINPADIHNELTKIYAFMHEKNMTCSEKVQLVKNNPYAACQANHFVFRNVIDYLICPKNEIEIFGNVENYCGVVEAQSRGSLHMHMMIWIEGSETPEDIATKRVECNEFKQKLLQYISTCFREDLPKNVQIDRNDLHPCKVPYSIYTDHEELKTYTID